ncbi:MAG TPA: chloride channel protein [Candidatus Polarisedimenticolia bacterium]|nr:chloride channel protein [Candidatus Polarisedimenticolia bacterium]
MSGLPSPISLPSDAPGTTSPETRARLRALWDLWTREIFTTGEERLFLLLAIIIGIFSGLSVVCFRVAIEWTQFALLGPSPQPSPIRLLLVPAIAGLGVALAVIYAFPRARGSGVNQTKAAVYVSNGYIPFNTVIGKFLTCALAIGSGQSLGPEDPSLQMGAGIASAIGRALRLSQRKIRLIAPVGAAAGLAAAFNAPISAVIFVIEEVIGTWSAGVLGAIVLAAVSSVITMRWFLGPAPMFRVPPIHIAHPAEYLAYGVLGVVGGATSLLFLKWLAYVRPRAHAWPRWTHYIQPAAAGLVIGVIGIRLPQVMGAGYPIIDQALHAQFAWRLLFVLALVKLFATGLSFISGTPGGMFAPTLFIGAMLGGAVGGVEHHFFPSLTGTIGTFALVGMGTFFAGFLRAPITSIFMVIEVSGNYAAALPVMASSLIAYLISRRYQKTPLFDLLSRQDGLILPSLEERREQVAIAIEDAMRPADVILVRPDETVANLARRAAEKKDVPVLIRVRVGVWRLVDRDDLRRAAADASTSLPAPQVTSRGPLPMLFPDEPLEEALRWVGDWPVLPVVSRADLGRLEGILTLPDVLHAVQKAAAD